MSHFTKLDKAQVRDVKAFLAVCLDMGMTEVQHNCEMRAWDREDAPVQVDVFAKLPGCQYGIGLIKNATGSYDMISDWSLTGASLPTAIKKKIPKYQQFPGKDLPGDAGEACDSLRGIVLRDVTRQTIVNTYTRQGFRATFAEDEKGNVNVRLRRA